MKNLKALFDTREAHFTEYTTRIFGGIIPALECITTYLTDIDSLVAQGIITWEDVTMIEDMLVFLGTVNFTTGDVITIGNDEYQITEENEEEFEHIVHISIPFDLVNSGNEERMMEHLYSAGSNKDIDEFIETIVPDIARINIESTPTSTNDFDLSELSEKQLQALKLSTSKGNN